MTEHTNNTWHILGAGAIGCLWASHLPDNKRRVHLILSPRHATPAKGTVNVHLKTQQGSRKSVTVNASSARELVAPINNLIVSTKANQVLDAAQSIADHIAPGARIVLLLNGMGFQQAVIAKFSNCQVFAGVTTDGAWLKQPFDVVQAGKGVTTLGALSSAARTQDLAALLHDLRNTGLLLKTTATIGKVLLEKVMVNAAINGLTAIHNCPNGKLLEIPAARAQLRRLVEELQTVLQASNEEQLAALLPRTVQQVIEHTAQNFSSTYQDVKHRRQTEIDFINGYVCKLGQQLGVDTPCNQEIVAAIRALGKS